MRKNGINRELRPISGGICAPEGYLANGVASGIRADNGLDFGMIFTKRRCSVGCVYATGNTVGAPVKVSKKNMRNGYARAVLVNGGVANALQKEGEKLALSVCDLFFYYGIERTEIVLTSTGEMGKPLTLAPFQKSFRSLYEGLGASEEHGALLTQAMHGEGEAKQLSFAFDLGDYPCKMGVVFKGGRYSAPNMATFLAFLTTDVNITAPMLQKALEAEVRETLNQLNVGGTPSPNDTVCILANGGAGNYRIDRQDSEYKKFTYALRAVLKEICLTTARAVGQAFTCKVTGGISKEVARSVAKSVVGASGVKASLAQGYVDVESVFCTLAEKATLEYPEKVRIELRSDKRGVTLYEANRAFPFAKELLTSLFADGEVEIFLDMQAGNYSAIAIGSIEKK